MHRAQDVVEQALVTALVLMGLTGLGVALRRLGNNDLLREPAPTPRRGSRYQPNPRVDPAGAC